GNVRVSAIRGNFDDAHTAVKEIFSKMKAEASGDERTVLSSANSINIGRLVPQIVYYFKAYADLLKEGAIRINDPVDFTVPTGNFGDILAGYLARTLGLPVGRLICASNQNDVLTDFLMSGVYDRRRPFRKTGSPSMDILVSSNLERLLYMTAGENASEAVRGWMKELSENGVYTIPSEMLAKIREVFVPGSASEEETGETIRKVFKKHHYLLDPHTAVAWCVSEKISAEDRAVSEAYEAALGNAEAQKKAVEKRHYSAGSPGAGKAMVVLSTASPYKFPRTVLEALGRTPGDDDFLVMDELRQVTRSAVPENLAALKDKPVRFTEVLNREELYSVVKEEMKG
ncbi:MAG: threonine synthase, partial [Lachnospiraceae bacterium]|nr:threonine synthase [Lachnospiraceae bacterium]